MNSAHAKARNGSALLVAVISLMAAATVGAGILAIATSSRHERVTLGITNRAYYLAESGAAYVRSRSAREVDYPPFEGHPPLTNTFPNGDQFIVSAYRTNVLVTTTNPAGDIVVVPDLHTIATSVGLVNPGSALSSRQQIQFDMLVSGKSLEEFNTGVTLFEGDFNSPDYRDDLFTETGMSKVEVKNTGPSRGIAITPKLDNSSGEGLMTLDWRNQSTLSNLFVYAYRAKDNLLSYDIQVKLAYFPNVPSTHFMMGLSFRLREDTGETYGISFFRSATNNSKKVVQNAPWVNLLDDRFESLRGTNFHLVLWYRAGAGSTIKLINSRMLSEDFLNMESDEVELAYNNTLLLQLNERYTDVARTNRENLVVAYLSTTNQYATWPNYATTNALWQTNASAFPDSNYAPVTWDQQPIAPATGNSVTNIDRRITSAGFNINQPAEIGLHLFYDRSSANETFLRDLAIDLGSIGSEFGGSQIQW